MFIIPLYIGVGEVHSSRGGGKHQGPRAESMPDLLKEQQEDAGVAGV